MKNPGYKNEGSAKKCNFSDKNSKEVKMKTGYDDIVKKMHALRTR